MTQLNKDNWWVFVGKASAITAKQRLGESVAVGLTSSVPFVHAS